MRGDQNFMLTAGSDEDAPSLLVGQDDERRVVISVMSDGEGGARATAATGGQFGLG
jgi:hypothetical protein